MITIKSNREIELLRIAGNIVHETRMYLIPFIKEGITTLELDTLAEEFIRSKGATPSFKGYNDFPGSICTSINEEVVHGIPSERHLRNGDIISIDIGACYKGYHGDSAWTFAVGEISPKKEELMEHTKESLFAGLKEVKPGNHIGDISHAVEECAKKYNLGVVRELVGHGVGTSIHVEEDPERS
jgi:methionyl aminopeptidase